MPPTTIRSRHTQFRRCVLPQSHRPGEALHPLSIVEHGHQHGTDGGGGVPCLLTLTFDNTVVIMKVHKFHEGGSERERFRHGQCNLDTIGEGDYPLGAITIDQFHLTNDGGVNCLAPLELLYNANLVLVLRVVGINIESNMTIHGA